MGLHRSVEQPVGRDLLKEAVALVNAASAREIVVRLAGALGIQRRCPDAWTIAEAHGRATGDVDLIALGQQWDLLVEFFEGSGYVLDERHAMLHGKERLNFFHESGFRVDVFLDKLSMCHEIDLRDRLQVHSETLPLADLLLQKIQIVELTHKDEVDIITLLHEHDVSEDESGVNGPYIGALLARNWGFFHTATQNLVHVRDESLFKIPSLSDTHRNVVVRRLERLLVELEAHPKTIGWRTRAKIGTRVKWYREVDDLVR
jgi:hypothetical protein